MEKKYIVKLVVEEYDFKDLVEKYAENIRAVETKEEIKEEKSE